MDTNLSEQELEAITGYRTPSRQLQTLHARGFSRAYRNRQGKAVLDDLMQDCEALAAERRIKFQRFSLQDCRPKGATDKLTAGHIDAKDALGHTTDRMLGQVYDRRQLKKATPAR